MSLHFFVVALVLMVAVQVKTHVKWCGLRPDSEIIYIQKTRDVGPWKVTIGDCSFPNTPEKQSKASHRKALEGFTKHRLFSSANVAQVRHGRYQRESALH
jgi:hypothetical protein